MTQEQKTNEQIDKIINIGDRVYFLTKRRGHLLSTAIEQALNEENANGSISEGVIKTMMHCNNVELEEYGCDIAYGMRRHRLIDATLALLKLDNNRREEEAREICLNGGLILSVYPIVISDIVKEIETNNLI